MGIEDDVILSDRAISNFAFVSNFFTSVTVIFGILSVWVIFRYSNKSMKEYRFYLLNIAITIFLSDMCLHFICRPYIIYPVVGVCFVGVIERPLISQFGVDAAIKVIFATIFFCSTSSIAAITNATIHRLVLTAKLGTQTKGLLFNKHFLRAIMVFLELLWPIVGCLLCLLADFRPDYAVEENFAINSKITQRTSYHPCYLMTYNFLRLIQSVYPTIPILAHVTTCAAASTLIVLLCWRQIMNAQKKARSNKTIEMEKQFMISLGIQSFTPNVLFLLGAIIISVCFFSASTWIGVIVNLLLRCGSAHTIANFLIMAYTIPTFRRGISRDFRRYVLRENTTITVLWRTTSSSRL